MTSLERHDDLWVLNLGDGDNRFDGDTVPAIHAALDEVAQTSGPTALITTASGKIWSNGLDLDHVGSLGDEWTGFLRQVEGIFAKLLRLPLFTVAAVHGHCFAGGAMLALAHDQRVMRSDRGYFCLPEVDLGIPFTDGMAALIGAKLSQPTLHRVAVMGERLTGPQALAAGIVDAIAGEGGVFPLATERATTLAPKAKPTVALLRANFYGSALAALEGTTPENS